MKKQYLFRGIVILSMALILCSCGSSESKYTTNQDAGTKDKEQNSSSTGQAVNENVTSSEVEGSFISKCTTFSTEYEIETYSNDIYIVSKNNGLLYGALNKYGEELLPVSYDRIKLVKDDKESIVYLQAAYEGSVKLFNSKGEELGNVDGSVELQDTVFGSDVLVLVRKKVDDGTRSYYDIYNTDLSEILAKDIYVDSEGLHCFTKEYYLGYAGKQFGNSILYNAAGNTVVEFDSGWVEGGYTDKKAAAFLGVEEGTYIFALSNGYDAGVYSIDSNANIKQIISYADTAVYDSKNGLVFISQSDKVTLSVSEEYDDIIYLNNGILLYQTNKTYKLVDDSGKPLYEERYYKYKRLNSGLYALVNEDNLVCIINMDGKIVIDYNAGFTYNTSSNKVLFQGMVIDNGDNFFSCASGFSIIQGDMVLHYEY